MKAPLILEIKGNSLDDGPGIRSVVFFKGCPLNCIWCHNPESKKPQQELSFDKDVCIGCGSCASVCQKKALDRSNPYFADRKSCDLCGSCTEVCPSKALGFAGKEIPQDEVFQKLLSDKVFYDISGGGVTLSGGEATLHLKWVGELARRLSDAGINVLLETCGCFDYSLAETELLPYVRDIYCDLKIFDREMHKKYCGVYNDIILENAAKLQEDAAEFGYSLLMRIPLIPGITDTAENLEALAGFMAENGMKNASLLPYNPTWYGKNDKLGIPLADELKGLTAWQTPAETERCRNIFRSRGINC
ncbi:MAG: glycyl-radical enzyme activating protein [Eubacterium sp.]|nr:glycyl-radical enzyme activating protein [Eubacterium sp.]